MKLKYKYLVIVALILGVWSENSKASDNLESIIRDMLKRDYPVSYIQSYMQPFATAFGTAVVSGIYHRAFNKEFPHADLGIKAIRMKVPESGQYFKFENEKVPTVFGPVTQDSAKVPGTGCHEYTIPMYQFSMGMFSGFEVMIRGSKYNISDIGNMDFFGIGVKYGLSDIVPIMAIPLDMSVQVIYHTYSIGNWLNSGTFAMNLHTSTDLKVIPLNIYGGIGYESTSLKLSTDEISDIGSSAVGDISINGQNKLRGTLGAGFTLWLLNIHAEYNFGIYNSAAAGAMIVF